MKAIEAAKCCENATNSKPVCDECIADSELLMSQYLDEPENSKAMTITQLNKKAIAVTGLPDAQNKPLKN